MRLWPFLLATTTVLVASCASDSACEEGGGDGDGDRICEVVDNCPEIPNPDQADADDDGVGDRCDPDPQACNSPHETACSRSGTACASQGGDTDGDQVCESHDNCPTVANRDQSDADRDGLGDACDETPRPCDAAGGDMDGDGICNGSDNCPLLANPTQLDRDADGRGDACDDVIDVADRECAGDGGDDDDDDYCGLTDNCPDVHNPDQKDTDEDGIGDACDKEECDGVDNNDDGQVDEGYPDGDGDGVADCVDVCRSDPDEDLDEDGIVDCADACPDDPINDVDRDGICGTQDNCPDVSNFNQSDRDEDGIGDSCDVEECDGISNDADTQVDEGMPDEDNDGVCDAIDECPDDPVNDQDGDGTCADADSCPTTPNAGDTDTDGDGIGDACDLDFECGAPAPWMDDPELPSPDTIEDSAVHGDTLYVTIANPEPPYEADLVAIDLPSRSVRWRTAVGGTPRLLAVADNGSRAWVSMGGAASVRMVDLTQRRPCGSFAVWSEGLSLAEPRALGVIPGRANSVVVSVGVSYDQSAYIYDAGQRRQRRARFEQALIAVDAKTAYSYEYPDRLQVHPIRSHGFSRATEYIGALDRGPALYLEGLLYTTSGLVVDPAVPRRVVDLPQNGLVAGNGGRDEVYFARSMPNPDTGMVVSAWDTNTWTWKGDASVPWPTRLSTSGKLHAWGDAGLVGIFRAYSSGDPDLLWIVDDIGAELSQ